MTPGERKKGARVAAPLPYESKNTRGNEYRVWLLLFFHREFHGGADFAMQL